jgi:hypothetical protein
MAWERWPVRVRHGPLHKVNNQIISTNFQAPNLNFQKIKEVFMRKGENGKINIRKLPFGWGHQDVVTLEVKKIPVAKVIQLMEGYTTAKTSDSKK